MDQFLSTAKPVTQILIQSNLSEFVIRSDLDFIEGFLLQTYFVTCVIENDRSGFNSLGWEVNDFLPSNKKLNFNQLTNVSFSRFLRIKV